MGKINNFFENFSNGIYWVLIGTIVALIIATAVLFLYALLVKEMNEHKHATAVRNACATWMTGGLLSLIAIVFFDSSQSIISMTFVEPYFVIFFLSSLIAPFKMFGAKTLKIDITTLKSVDLGLPSGKLWATENVKNKNGDKNHFTFDEAVKTFGKNLPSKEDWKELFDNCSCKWNKEKKGFDITGSNGNSIFLPAAGYRYDVGVYGVGSYGFYWSSSVYNEYHAYYVYLRSDDLNPRNSSSRNDKFSVRLIR